MKEAAILFFVVVFFLSVKKGLGFFSVFFLIFLFIFAVNPPLKKKGVKERKSLSVLLDVSESMGVSDCGSGVTREEMAKRIMRKILTRLRKGYKIAFYTFGKNLKKVNAHVFFTSTPSEKATDINGSLEDISRISSPRGKVLLFSDGRQNISARANFLMPVYCVGMGKPSGDDVSVEVESFPQKAFEGISQRVWVKVKREGNIKSVNLAVFERSRKLCEKRIDFLRTEFEKEVSIDFVPHGHGKNIRFKVAVRPLDTNPSNNTTFFRMPVFKSKLKILFISGRPGWEYRYIRAFIKSNPNVDLVSFVILRNPEDYVPFPDNKLSLIPFPVRKIFLQDIATYDLVILLNFDYRRFMPDSYLNPLAAHIRKGGGFMLIGGENVFKNGNYAESPLGDILPGDISAASVFRDKKFFLKVSPSHPITAYISKIKGVGKVQLNGLNIVSARKSAQLLLETKKGIPVALASTAGNGRVIMILTNDLWRIFFGNVELGYFYQEFFRNSIRWLTKSPLLDEILVSGKKEYHVGERMSLIVRVKNSNARLSAKLYSPRGVEFLTPQLQTSRVYKVEKLLEVPGNYRIDFEMREAENYRARQRFEFSVKKREMEKADMRTDFSKLKNIAELSGGAFCDYNSFERNFREFLDTKTPSFFWYPSRTPLFIFLLVLLAGLKWWWENYK